MKRAHPSFITGCSTFDGRVYVYTKPTSPGPSTALHRNVRHLINSHESLTAFCVQHVKQPLEAFLDSWNHSSSVHQLIFYTSSSSHTTTMHDTSTSRSRVMHDTSSNRYILIYTLTLYSNTRYLIISLYSNARHPINLLYINARHLINSLQ